MGMRLTARIATIDTAYAFGPFLLLPAHAVLLEHGTAVRIGRRAFDVLAVLVAAHGRVVGKRELLARAWPGLVVEDGNLKVHIAAIRRLLGEDAGAGASRHIATVAGRGYRFIAPVREVGHVPPAPAPRRGNLALVNAAIFGRDAVIDAIVQDLEATRLVSVVGPGGVGKTTVALAVAQRAGAMFDGGCWHVDLAALEHAAQVPDAVAAILPAGDGKALLVLDNCEHMVGAVALCADHLLASTRNVKLLVTSREPLCIRGERVRRLPGLATPPDGDGPDAGDAGAWPAVQLFAARAAEAAPAFTLDATNTAQVGAICRRLDGLPLAIERVAQRAGTLGVGAMLDHLARRFHMFDGFHAGPARHRTLTATVHASYLLLSPGEQATLRRLSIFTGSFSLASACAVCCADADARPAMLEDIASLVAKSLLLAQPCDGDMAYRQGHVTRAFALEQLIAHDELKDAQWRRAQGADA
jgi:predicted ATPase/DNA-binding winged helix-turn-helix (wHTH) protein